MPATAHGPRRPRPSLLMLVVLMMLWVAMWGDLTPGNLVAGFGIAMLVTLLAPLPRGAKRRLVVRPLPTLKLVAHFLRDIVVSALEISALVLRNQQPRSAVIRVRLRSHSDMFLTATAGLTSLVPGSIVVDANRMAGTLYIHVFDVNMAGGLDRAHQIVLEQEERLLRAFATVDELSDARLLADKEAQ